jgi:hypothetical protein
LAREALSKGKGRCLVLRHGDALRFLHVFPADVFSLLPAIGVQGVQLCGFVKYRIGPQLAGTLAYPGCGVLVNTTTFW